MGTQWEIDIDQGGRDVTLKVMAFTDTVCIGEGEELCNDDFKFYPIYEQTNLSSHEDGVLGIAPLQTQKKRENEGPSFVDSLKKSGKIDRAIVALFVSRFESKQHSIQIGDFDPSYVEGGEETIEWFSLTVDNMGWKWQTDLTDATFGSTQLFTHDFKWVEINAGYHSMGLTSEDFSKVSDLLTESDPNNVYCDNDRCLIKKKCADYMGKLPQLTMTLSNRITYRIPGDKLLRNHTVEVEDQGKFLCEVQLQNSGDHYRMGTLFLEDYYSIYDIDNFKMGLGRTVNFEPPATKEEEIAEEAKEASDSKTSHDTTGDGSADTNTDSNGGDKSKDSDNDSTPDNNQTDPDSSSSQ